ncbi:hypothetical protein D3C71_1550770 [compost metagenome]
MGGFADQVQVVDAAIHQARGPLGTRDGRHEGVRAGCQHQLVVTDAAVGGNDLTRVAVDVQHRLAQMQREPVAFIEGGIAHRHGFGVAAIQVFGQVDAVVGAARFLAIDVDAIALKRALGDQLFDAMVAHHAVADHHQGLQGIGSGRCFHEYPQACGLGFKRQKAPWTFRSGRLCRYCLNCVAGLAACMNNLSKDHARFS